MKSQKKIRQNYLKLSKEKIRKVLYGCLYNPKDDNYMSLAIKYGNKEYFLIKSQELLDEYKLKKNIKNLRQAISLLATIIVLDLEGFDEYKSK